MYSFETVIGLAAAACTALANLPQLLKAWRTGETEDVSLRMLLVLTTGLSLWIVYGALRGDGVIILANAVSVTIVAGLLVLKLRDLRGGPRKGGDLSTALRKPDPP